MKASRPRTSETELNAVELIEEAVHLLRQAPLGSLSIYYAGTIPFALGLLFFWAHTTWFMPSGAKLALTSLFLVGLFASMKATQAEFCRRLLAQRLGVEPVPLTPGRLARLAGVQVCLQAWGLFLVPLAALMTVPFGWVFAYFQTVSVMGESPGAAADARVQTALWPGQNHFGLAIMGVLAFWTGLNLAAMFWLVPWLANRLLGIENLFGLSGRWFANTTFLASVSVMTWLAIDPLVKAFYTLRVFHGQARRTGEDVRVELRAARRRKSATRIAAAGVLFLATLGEPPQLRAGEPPSVSPPARAAVVAAQLDDAIDRTLAGPDFQWRLRPPPEAENLRREGPIRRFMRECGLLVRSALRSAGRAIGRLVDWIWNLLPSRRGSSAKEERSGASSFLGGLLVALIAAAVLLIVWVVVLIGKRSRHFATPVVTARAVAAAAPDLQDENTQAAQLPADGWLALAREKMRLGEWRLALRALYLATLAQLAAEGLVSLAKFKTNLDYERELRRRALARQEVVARFSQRRHGFEAAWYGRAAPTEADARAWLAELEPPSLP